MGLEGVEIVGLRGVERLDRRRGAFVVELAVELDDLSGFEGAAGLASLLVVALAQRRSPHSEATQGRRPERCADALGAEDVREVAMFGGESLRAAAFRDPVLWNLPVCPSKPVRLRLRGVNRLRL
jgi:hypothetical protein